MPGGAQHPGRPTGGFGRQGGRACRRSEALMTLSIPSPPLDWAQFSIGPLTIHAYALWILAGIGVGLWITSQRWVARGGNAEAVTEVAFWAIPFGIVGGRLYHVISSPGPYFGEGGR